MTVDKDLSLSRETWRLFRIISEFVDGFEKLSTIGPAVSVFGSARTPRADRYYKMAVECSEKLSKAGFAVITGGGPGIMEAANRGAKRAKGHSIGLNIALPLEQKPNEFQTHELTFRYFFVRKVMFVKYAKGFVCFPGGFGTMDEFFEALTLIQTLKLDPFPIVCVGHEFWDGLLGWIRQTMLEKFHTISDPDLNLLRVTDDVDEVVHILKSCYESECWLGPPAPPMSAEATETSAEGTRIGLDPRHSANPTVSDSDTDRG